MERFSGSSQATSTRLPGLAGVMLLLLGLLPGCRRGEAPLPPLDDLYEYSLAVAQRAADRVPSTRAQPIYNVGRVHERFGMEDRALDSYRQAIEKNPQLANAHRQIGFILSQRQDRMSEAIDAYMQALQADPGAAGLYTRIGLVYTHLGRLEEATQAFEQEIRAGGANAETYYNLGKAQSLRGEHEEAVKRYQKAIQLDPQMRTAHYGLATSYRALGDDARAAKADEAFRRLKAAEDEAAASSEPQKGNRAKQIRFAAETWLDAAEVFAAEASRATDTETRRDWQTRAVEAIRQAISVDPHHVEAHQSLVRFYRALGRPAVARQAAVAMARAFEDDPLTQYAAAQLVMQNADPADKHSSIEQSLSLLERAIELQPDLASANYQWAYLVLANFSDRPELVRQAATRAETALREDPRARCFDVLAWAYHRSGRLEDARATLERGIKEFPQDAELRKRLAAFDAKAR